MNKSFYERAIELTKQSKRVKDNGIYEKLAKEYNISLRNASDRFKSLFGKGVREYIRDINIPTREELRDAIIRNNSQEELLKDLNIHYDWIKGLYDKYFNTSTFQSAKWKLEDEVDIIPYNPTIEDNLSILISQRLGDGSFEFNNRMGLKLEHGYKQYDYLKFKINLLKKAFPTIPGIESIKKWDRDGYISYSYRTNNIRHRYMEIIKNISKVDLIERMTPFGWLLWYLDDGNLHISKRSNTLSIAISDILIQKEAIRVLKTYGFNFNISETSIIISNKSTIISFINSFIKPFIHLIPETMKYKCIVKI